ncbi:glycoside hydrolase family 16 protein [Kiritimatiellaeota bacterium B1221]|nr:glycoside hydrolase family 16 protein [Kiritimatiellaeota bacterium B1221]
MKKFCRLILGCWMPLVCMGATPAGDLPLIDFNQADVAEYVAENGAVRSFVETEEGLILQMQLETARNYPGVAVYPREGRWDLSEYSGVEVEVENLSDVTVRVVLRVDNNGANGKEHCNAEWIRIHPGTTAQLPVMFGRAYGNKGPELDTSNIVALQIFAGKSTAERSLAVHSVRAFSGDRKPVQPPKKAPKVKLKPVQVDGYPFHINLEEKPAIVGLDGGSFTRDPARVIEGAVSLYGDSKGKDRPWFEFAKTAPGIFEPGYKYTVTYKYRILTREPGAQVYAFMRSQAQGWGRWDRGWTNISEEAMASDELQTGELTFGLQTQNDYQLNFGIKGNASVVIDEIKIVRGEAFVEVDLEDQRIQAIPEAATLYRSWDFESADAELRLRDPRALVEEGALAGKTSLLLDSMASNQRWNVALSVPKEILPGGYRYYVHLKSDAVAWGQGKPYAYIVVKEAQGKRKDIVWKRWRGPVGVPHSVYTAFDVPEDQSAALDVAVFKQGKVLIDDLVIRREPLAEKAITTHQAIVPEESVLVWSDEFDGETLDEQKWSATRQPRTGGWWNPDNVSVEDGNLVLTFSKKDGVYSMGEVNTAKSFTFRYGYVEARMKLPEEPGHWPGIWLMGAGVKSVGNEGRDGTEIDIVECPFNGKDIASHALHWDGYGLDHQSQGHHPEVPGLQEGFHTFAVNWSPEGYIFFIDGKETWRTDAGGVCRIPLHIILSDEMGGWSGDPSKAKNLPDRTYIDYIRVWQSPEQIELNKE